MSGQITTLLRDQQTGIVAAAYSNTGVKVENAKGYCIEIDVTVATAAAKTFITGAKETTTVLCVADTGVKEIQTLTFPAFASITDRDYIIVEDTLGGKWAVYADKTGSSAAPTGALYTAIPAANKTKADISGATTAAQVAAIFETSFDGLTGFTAKIITDDTAADGTMTFTQTKVGPVVNPVPKNLDDTGAGTLSGVQTTGGVASNLNNKYINLYSSPDEGATEVRNVFWFNVNSEGTAPVIADAVITAVALSAGAADTAVASALNTAVDALSDLTSTVSSATVTVVNADVGDVTAGSNGSGASPGFTINVTTPGTENAFSITNNTITISSHGFYDGLKVAASTATTLPTGLSATDYYVIRVDANTIKLATSAVNALAGTAVDITGNGVAGTHTLTPASISGASYKLQGAVIGSDGAAGTYVDLSVTNNVTATASFIHEKIEPMYDYVRVVWAMTAGQIGYTINTVVKGEE